MFHCSDEDMCGRLGRAYKTAALPIELRQPAHKIAFELCLAQYQ